MKFELYMGMIVWMCEDIVVVCLCDFVVCSFFEVVLFYLGLYVVWVYCVLYVLWCCCFWLFVCVCL